jgi:hypothetical protein
MSGPLEWNPDDGPPPTDEERAEASALRDALSSAGDVPRGGSVADERRAELLALAAGIRTIDRAPSHTDVDRVVRSAVDHAVAGRASPGRGGLRWKLTAVAALMLVGVGGARLYSRSAELADTPSISREADDVLTRDLGMDPGSGPITRIEQARVRGYRQGLFKSTRAGR